MMLKLATAVQPIVLVVGAGAGGEVIGACIGGARKILAVEQDTHQFKALQHRLTVMQGDGFEDESKWVDDQAILMKDMLKYTSTWGQGPVLHDDTEEADFFRYAEEVKALHIRHRKPEAWDKNTCSVCGDSKSAGISRCDECGRKMHTKCANRTSLCKKHVCCSTGCVKKHKELGCRPPTKEKKGKGKPGSASKRKKPADTPDNEVSPKPSPLSSSSGVPAPPPESAAGSESPLKRTKLTLKPPDKSEKAKSKPKPSPAKGKATTLADTTPHDRTQVSK
jgi:hypothetical protein